MESLGNLHIKINVISELCGKKIKPQKNVGHGAFTCVVIM